jgi:hypothetical protein
MSESRTGTDAIRAALYARAHKGHLAYLARDLTIGTAVLEDFVHGKGRLPPEVLRALAREIYGDNVEFDPERDLLRRVPQPAIPLGNRPPPIHELMELPKFEGGPAPRSFRPVKPMLPVTKTKRLGWL